MSEIRISTESVKSLAVKMRGCADRMGVIETNTINATKLIENGVLNSSIGNMNSKMAALRKKVTKLHTDLEGNYDLLMFIAQKFEEADHPTRNLIPDWAKEKFNDSRYYRAENGSSGYVYYRNGGGEVSCTYYTLHKLKDRGLGFPFKYAGGANGGNWFNNCSDSAKKYPGNDCLTNIMNEYGASGKPVQNIVISMGGNPGHVLLIDKMYKDPNSGQIMVEWSDMCYPFNKIYGDVNTLNPTKNVTLDQFKKYYSWGGNISGAVLIGEA
ncbi:MAG: hypothetical protein IKR22_00560 [Clostridiales bacterium]|nr:hypothetical protein [Clostridiales bacterium]